MLLASSYKNDDRIRQYHRQKGLNFAKDPGIGLPGGKDLINQPC